LTGWSWGNVKSRSNSAEHSVHIELAMIVFEDPLAVSRFEMSYEGEERWQTVGMVGPVLVFVVHTLPDVDSPGRIISARKATRHERKAYEEGEF
jgi:uncharacterized DUF497 family protein